MVSRVYAAGSRATAITNIVADVGALYTFQADGTKALDTSALRAYLDAQLLLVKSDGALPSGVTTAMVDAAMRTVDVTRFTNQLDAAICKERFMGRSDWPRSFGTVTGDYLVGAIKTGLTELKSLVENVTAHYYPLGDPTGTDLRTVLGNLYDEFNVDAQVPEGVTRIVNTRTYVYAYRTDKGEISAPSDPSELIEVDQNDSADLTAAAPPANRNVTEVLWYRSNSSATDDAFQYVDVKAVADGLTYNDTKVAEELQEPCPSFDWLEPVSNMKGLKLHPNSFGVGWYENTVAFSVANRLYAWPSSYRKTVPNPIVGLGIFGTTVFVGCKGEPYLMNGTDPAAMSAERVNGGQACRSARSIVSTSQGIVYAGADGIVLCTGLSDTPVLTRDHWTKEQWEDLNPESIFATEHDGCYYFWSNGTAGAKCYSLGLRNGKLVEVEITASAVFLNPDNDKLYAMSGSNIREVFGGSGKRTATWKSPRISGSAVNFSWKKIKGDFENGLLTITWHRHFINRATGALSSDAVVHQVTTRLPSRLPPGRPDEYEVELVGKSKATMVALTTDVNELKGV